MKIFYSPASPFVRKVHVAALELGLDERLEKLPSAAHPVNRDANIVEHNPTGKVPTFFTDDNEVLFDSRVICEYLDSLAGGNKLFPLAGAARWRALREQAVGDGLIEAALLVRYETLVRPKEFCWQPWLDGQWAKLRSSLTVIETMAPTLGERFDIGTLTLACTLGYLDFRFKDQLDWRADHPAAAVWFESVSKRASLIAAPPHDWKPA